jgi:hypothetical protein
MGEGGRTDKEGYVGKLESFGKKEEIRVEPQKSTPADLSTVPVELCLMS